MHQKAHKNFNDQPSLLTAMKIDNDNNGSASIKLNGKVANAIDDVVLIEEEENDALKIS